MGTPCYMAPEQAGRKGVRVGPPADIYALGSILYEMLTGRPPFDADTPAETIAQVLNDDPVPPNRLRPKLPRDLVTICLKCLEKAPRKRYTSAFELAEDLRRFQAGEPIRAVPVGIVERSIRWCRRRPLVASLAGLCGLLAIAFVVTVLIYNRRLTAALALVETRNAEQRRQIVQLNINIGIGESESGDSLAALLRFTEALRLDQGSPYERNHRTRIGTALRQCPRLVESRTLDKSILCASVTATGVRVATLSANHILEVVDALTGRRMSPRLALDGKPIGGAFSPDGRWLATIGPAGTVRVWELATGKFTEVPLPAGQAVERVAYHPTARVLLTHHADASICLWDLAASAPTAMTVPGTIVTPAALSDHAGWLFALENDNSGHLVDAGTGKRFAKLPSDAGTAFATISADGRRVALVGTDAVIRIWDVAAGRWLGQPLRPGHAVSRAVLSPDGERIVTLGNDQTVRLWQVKTGETTLALPACEAAITHVQFSPDGRRLMVADGPGGVRVWDTTTGHAITPPLQHDGGLVAVTPLADGNRIVAVTRAGGVRIWELPGELRANGEPHAAAEPPSILTDLSGARRRTVQLHNGITVQVDQPTTGSRLRLPRPMDKTVNLAAFSPDGSCVVTGDVHAACVWNTSTGRLLTAPLKHKGTVLYAAFSPDGRRLFTAGDDRTLHVWDVASGEPLTPPLHHAATIRRAFFRNGGNEVVVMHEGGGARIWNLLPDERPVDELVAEVGRLVNTGR